MLARLAAVAQPLQPRFGLMATMLSPYLRLRGAAEAPIKAAAVAVARQRCCWTMSCSLSQREGAGETRMVTTLLLVALVVPRAGPVQPQTVASAAMVVRVARRRGREQRGVATVGSTQLRRRGLVKLVVLVA